MGKGWLKTFALTRSRQDDSVLHIIRRVPQGPPKKGALFEVTDGEHKVLCYSTKVIGEGIWVIPTNVYFYIHPTANHEPILILENYSTPLKKMGDWDDKFLGCCPWLSNDEDVKYVLNYWETNLETPLQNLSDVILGYVLRNKTNKNTEESGIYQQDTHSSTTNRVTKRLAIEEVMDKIYSKIPKGPGVEELRQSYREVLMDFTDPRDIYYDERNVLVVLDEKNAEKAQVEPQEIDNIDFDVLSGAFVDTFCSQKPVKFLPDEDVGGTIFLSKLPPIFSDPLLNANTDRKVETIKKDTRESTKTRENQGIETGENVDHQKNCESGVLLRKSSEETKKYLGDEDIGICNNSEPGVTEQGYKHVENESINRNTNDNVIGASSKSDNDNNNNNDQHKNSKNNTDKTDKELKNERLQRSHDERLAAAKCFMKFRLGSPRIYIK